MEKVVHEFLEWSRPHRWLSYACYSALIMFLFCASLSAEVVINELMYDPIDADTGKEWIELFNNGTSTVNLAGAKIQKAGATFETVFTFPAFLLRPGRYVLVGESQVSQAAFIATLQFQNGGSATDGVRYLSSDESYTDTVLYDYPNTSLLPDDTGIPGSGWAEDVSAGYSLARKWDGVDTNDCSVDFIAELNPTPGYANHVDCDFALRNPLVYQDNSSWILSVWVVNCSEISPAFSLKLLVSLDNQACQTLDLNPIAALDSTELTIALPIYDMDNHIIGLELQVQDDSNPVNNSWNYTLVQSQPTLPLINEFMYDPQPGHPEWIELHVEQPYVSELDYELFDNAGNSGDFSLPAGAGGYIILCNHRDIFLSAFPECAQSTVLELNAWPQLNNTGDSIILRSANATIDSVSYAGDSYHRGQSLERSNMSAPVSWRYSVDPSGATPGRQNSIDIPPDVTFSGRLKLEGSPLHPISGASLRLYYQLPDATSRVSCHVYDLQGRKQRSLATNLTVGQSGYIEWDGADIHGKYLARGLYIILWESQSSTGGKIYRKQLTAVIDRG
ncbi:MAG: hypothetical protein CVU48_05825 [Candidatus Cloacimonetes bacterium HGW-Cloacimonetes-1]|jgi:hypothetical protein|nr:MAG: hypothetical protein CVU48_05825 [Candidatus Cloacimonetes bacterium HGW-Cloacimonetes-1]